MTDDRRVVWVLGAGFSRALGGPLLPDLLSDESVRDLLACYPQEKYPALYDIAAVRARDLYVYGRSDRPGRKENLWANAEAFLDYVDTAAAPRSKGQLNPHLERLKNLADGFLTGAPGPGVTIPGKLTIDQLRASARRLVAGECCAFLEGVDPKREHWRPFRTWATSLTPNDTIVSFNYDRVVERLRDALIAENYPSKIVVVAPNEADTPSIWKDSIPLLKLHGSVDWQKVSPTRVSATLETIVQHRNACFALTSPDTELAIATPGPSKMRESSGGLRKLWEVAREALKCAHAIVFVGFRFPETDAFAREQLLEAIGENVPVFGTPAEAGNLSIHVVLGVDRPRDSERLASLLRFACQRQRDELRRDATGTRSSLGLQRKDASPLCAGLLHGRKARRSPLVTRPLAPFET